MNAVDLCFLPAAEMGRLIRRRDLSPVELTDAVLARIDRLNPTLNAYLTVTAELAREGARAAEERAVRGALLGPLDGIPYSLKDLMSTAGIRTTFGSKWFKHHVPTEDGIVVERLREAGGVLLGKTNTPQFGHKDMCDNLLGGACRNPWKLDRTSGGSSGGAAAAVASGLGPLAQGGDGAGSIRIPAALCGVFGLKPSLGRVPYYPSSDYFAARAQIGPITRTVRDAALMLSVIAGPDPRDPLSIDAAPVDYVAACDGDLRGLRVVWSPDLGFGTVDPEVRAITEQAVRRFSNLDCVLDAVATRWPDPRDFHKIIYEVAQASRYGQKAAERPDWIEPSLARMIYNGNRVSAVEYGRALAERSRFYDAVRSFFTTHDLLVTPQMPVGAWSVSQEPIAIGGKPTPTMFDRLPFAYPFNLTGQPAASVPCGFTSEGLPVALQIVGRWHADATVLRAAAAYETMQPWSQHRPLLN